MNTENICIRYSKHNILILMLMIFLALPTISFSRNEENPIIFSNGVQKLKIELVKHNIVKFSYRLIDEDYSAKTPSIINYSFPKVNYSYSETNSSFNILSDSLEIIVFKKNLSALIRKSSSGEIVIDTIHFATTYNYRGIYFRVDTNLGLYGLGSHALPFNRKGQPITLYNSNQFGYEYGKASLNANIPYFIFGNKTAILADNHSVIHCGIRKESKPYFNCFATQNDLDFYVITGNNHECLTKEYCELTGYQPMPPRWAFGYMQSSGSYAGANDVIKLVDRMKKADFPLEAVILDYLWVGKPNNVGNLSWNKDSWGNGADYVRKLSELGLKTILISEPHVSRYSRNYQHCLNSGFFCKDDADTVLIDEFLNTKGSLLDLTHPSALSWITGEQTNISSRDLIAGWWCDLGEPEPHSIKLKHAMGNALAIHNIFGFLWIDALNKSLNEALPAQRHFILTRAGWTGMQRCSSFPWSGDCKSSFSALRAQIPIMLGMGLSGSAYMHSDIGGFWGLKKNERLYTRWFQLGAFSPIMRVHSTGVVPPEPINYSDSVQRICKKFVDLRYSLLPYLYTLAYENSTTGSPICRAMNYYSHSPVFIDTEEQYYFGKDLLIAPITDSSDSQKIIFPEGRWIDFYTKEIFSGIDSVDYYAPLEIMPIFVRAGAIIPTIKPITNTTKYSLDTLILNYFLDDSTQQSSAYIYNDDGTNPKALNEEQFEIIRIKAENQDSTIRIRINRDNNKLKIVPNARVLIVNVYSNNKQFSNQAMQINSKSDTTFLNATSSLIEYSFTSKFITDTTEFILKKINYHDTIVEDEKTLKQLIVCPNPADDVLNIQIQNCRLLGDYSLKIYDTLGQLVMSNQDNIKAFNNDCVISIPLNESPNKLIKGIYLGKLFIDGEILNFNFNIGE